MSFIDRRCKEIAVDKILTDASSLIEELRYVDDLELVADDIVGCAAAGHDTPRTRTDRKRTKLA